MPSSCRRASANVAVGKLTLASLAARASFEAADHGGLTELQRHSNRLEQYTERFRQQAEKRIAEWETGDDDALKEIFGDGR